VHKTHDARGQSGAVRWGRDFATMSHAKSNGEHKTKKGHPGDGMALL